MIITAFNSFSLPSEIWCYISLQFYVQLLFNKHFSLQKHWIPITEEMQMKGIYYEIEMLCINNS